MSPWPSCNWEIIARFRGVPLINQNKIVLNTIACDISAQDLLFYSNPETVVLAGKFNIFVNAVIKGCVYSYFVPTTIRRNSGHVRVTETLAETDSECALWTRVLLL